jgi:hypothetical protein
MIEMLSYSKDIGFLIFGFTGAYFTYRAWRQREDEIKEKYFDRRYALYCSVEEAITKTLRPGNTLDFEWWNPLVEAKRQAKFLVGPRAQGSVSRLHELAIDYGSALEIEETDSRVTNAKTAREKIHAEFAVFKREMERYLLV